MVGLYCDVKTELEEENGFLAYGVEVVGADRAIEDVKVDAGSGEVLAVARDQEPKATISGWAIERQPP